MFSKVGVKGFVKLVAFLAFFVTLIYIVFSLTTVPKTPATAEQVWDVLVSLGYEPQDITVLYYEKDISFEQTLNQCIKFEKEGIHFEFFVFHNDSSAIDLYSQARSQIYRNISYPSIEGNWRAANYAIYTLETPETYSVAIYVGNTAVYAYSDAENANKITQILASIGYSSSSKTNQSGESQINETAVLRVIQTVGFLASALMIWLSLRWLWVLVCKTAGVTKHEVRMYRSKSRHKKNRHMSFSSWLINNAKNTKKIKRLLFIYRACMIPSLLCFSLSIISFFTNVFDVFLDGAIIVMLILPFVFGVIGVIYRKIEIFNDSGKRIE